ncbi:MAG: trypsin-like peptidase domain-containing protein [Oscillospiraceae bacterium]|nr:trypsin-like peptidase domain-containing protein [Oscillospiraceae bacterium]
MKRKIISAVLSLCLAMALCVPAMGAMSLANFVRVRTYQEAFSDVPETAWFSESVISVFERGIMDGRGQGMFDPHGQLTIAETIKIAASIHRNFHSGSMEFPQGAPWYMPYVDYAHRHGLHIGAFRSFNVPITRADFAAIMATALPDEALTPINHIDNGGIPDVFESFSYGQAVYMLYRAGVLTGSDSYGTFFPGRTLSRAEAATIVNRMIDADARVLQMRKVPLTSEQVYAGASPAVFLIHVYDRNDELVKHGSGFFISDDGLAITNYHVVVGGGSIFITMYDGEEFEVAGLYDFDRLNDTALIRVHGEDFPYLNVSDTPLQTGATVYALGSPLGLQASFSRGIVSQARRELYGMTFIQLDAAISTGSSGGALLDAFGRVVGVTTATMVGAQNINLAVPIDYFTILERTAYTPFSEHLIPTVYFDGFYPAPDFGAHFGVRAWDTRFALGGTSFSYRVSDIPGDVMDVIELYAHIIEQNLFEHMGDMVISGNVLTRFYNAQHDVIVSFGLEVIRSVEVFTVNVA